MRSGPGAGTLPTVDDRSNIGAQIEIIGSFALGLRRSTAASVAAAIPILGLAGGCQTGGGGERGFRVTNIAFDNDSTITLTFSEPLTDFDEVDPDAFRLSWATTASAPFSYEGQATYHYVLTTYNDLSAVLVDYYDYDYSADPFRFVSLSAGSSPYQIVLQTAESLGPELCETFKLALASAEEYAAGLPGSRFDLAIFLHYAGGTVPIESLLGSVLGDIGADWALNDEAYAMNDTFGFVNVAPQLRIPCP